MTSSELKKTDIFLQNRERIALKLKKYPNVVSVGVGLKEIANEITQTLCYRVYVSEKKDLDFLKQDERIPALIESFPTDVLPYGIIEAIAEKPVRPLKGGLKIKNESYINQDPRGVGTLGCLALYSDEEITDEIVGLTCDHVVYLNTQISDQPEIGSDGIAQPQKLICCCCCVKNMVGSVLESKRNVDLDCAIIRFHPDIVKEIKAKGSLNEIHEIGGIQGKAIASVDTAVKKSGAATGVTHGRVVDLRFDEHQILIAPVPPSAKFADFGDSGSVVVDENNRVMGLLWGTKRDRFKSDDPAVPGEDPRSPHNQTHRIKPRVHGVATPIDAVEKALKIKIPAPPPVKATISIHPDDTKTHVIPSTLPAAKKPKQHFVTAKGDGDVILKATFDQPVENERIKWVSDYEEIIFPGPSGDNTTARISRSALEGSRSLVGVTVDGYTVGEKVWVWIIWTEPHYHNLENPFEVKIEETQIKTTRIFRADFKIQPEKIFPVDINEDDVPDLRGSNAAPPPGVPDSETDVFNHGVDLSGGATRKWDATVALRYKIINPKNFFIDPQLPFSKSFPAYPSSKVVGNFDVSTAPFEDEDPYTDLSPIFRGRIGKTVLIEHTFPHSIAYFQGTKGDGIEFRINHKVFARVELNGTWYVISEEVPGRIQLEFRIRDEFYDFIDYNNDGDKLDKVWFGDDQTNQCFYDDSNNGF